MPTPLEILLDPVSLIVLSIYGVLMIWEALFPARQLPKIAFWKLRGLTAFAFFFYLSSYLPLFIDPYLEAYRLVDLTSLGALTGGSVGVLLYEFGVYIWHRSLHKSNFLWRTFHQMHHSAERLDTYGAFYFSPVDMIGWTVLGSICFALLVGLSPQAITVTLLVTNFLGMFQHANIKTPRWLGYIIQRPESHTVHHAKGIHKHNYSDLPIFDIIFGTFDNPRNYEHQTGFYHGASAKVLEMLSFKDLNKEREKSNKLKEVRKRSETIFSLILLLTLALGCSKDDGPGVLAEGASQENQAPNSENSDEMLPVIHSISPEEGSRTQFFKVKGQNLGSDVNQVTLLFGQVRAELDYAMEDSIQATIPRDAASGPIRLIVNGTAVEGPEFTYVPTGELLTLAGADYTGAQDGYGAGATFDYPWDLARDQQGNLYVADSFNNRIRKISPEGEVTTLAGSVKGDADGVGNQAQFKNPNGVAVDAEGNVYVADSGNDKIKKITPNGTVTTIAGGKKGSQDGVLSEAEFNGPMDVEVGPYGSLLIVDAGNHRIRKITAFGAVITVAGSVQGFMDGWGDLARFNYPYRVKVDKEGNLIVTDTENHRIRKIDVDGMVSTVAGGVLGNEDGLRLNASFNRPGGLAIDQQNNIYVSDIESSRLRKIDNEGNVTTLTGDRPGHIDGILQVGLMSRPRGLDIDAVGNLYVADTENQRIRKIILDEALVEE